jgi:CDP-glucose 4,6-dehydratase
MVARTARAAFWSGRRTLITGHTGFKGSWLSLLLAHLGARITGLALDPPTEPSLFEDARIAGRLAADVRGDIRNESLVRDTVAREKPEVVFHLAAQPLVRDSYKRSAETFSVNVMGTLNILEACRGSDSIRAVVVVTTDKVYENREWIWGYREIDALGGRDPYSSSKACAEIITAAYRASFRIGASGGLSTARAGNVIGGGDWAADRLIPDCIRAFQAGREVVVRNPLSIRPWQHVLDCLHGYLLLAESLADDGDKFAGAFNFGPFENEQVRVVEVVGLACRRWGGGARHRVEAPPESPHEAGQLWLDSTRARMLLQWRPFWGVTEAIGRTVNWYRARFDGADANTLCAEDIRALLAGDRAGEKG